MAILLKKIKMNEYILNFRTSTDNYTTNIINRYTLVLLNTLFTPFGYFSRDKLNRLYRGGSLKTLIKRKIRGKTGKI